MDWLWHQCLLHPGFHELGEGKFSASVTTLLDVNMRAEALGRAGQIGDGLVLVEEAIDHSERSEERWAFAELLRVKGMLLLLRDGASAGATAEEQFRQALDWARRQGALSWELRAATSLAQLRLDQGRFAEALALLRPVYDRFTEGFATEDLRAAKVVLDACASPEATP